MRLINPKKVRLEASSACQLKCPSCPTTQGVIARSIGTGFLKLDDFKKFIDDNPRLQEIELANWGEIFLNPDLIRIMQYADLKRVALRCDIGANFNRVSDDVLEAMVKHKFRSLTCSIDGASNETYVIYRRLGNFEEVINNIRRLNYFKEKYNSKWPLLIWQMVVFGHNEHEIVLARKMAQELNMRFWLKLSWGGMYTGEAFSPVKDKPLVQKESGLGAADREEYEQNYGETYSQKFMCSQLWTEPQIHFDGKVLGCCINHWGDFGNAFTEGLLHVLNNEKIQYARGMVKGLNQEREGIPCSSCTHYKSMKKNKNWMTDRDIFLSRLIYKFRYLLQDNKYRPFLSVYFSVKKIFGHRKYV